MFGFVKKWRRKSKLNKVRSISEKSGRKIRLSDARLSMLSDAELNDIINNNLLTDVHYYNMNITVGVDALGGKTAEEVRADYLAEHPEESAVNFFEKTPEESTVEDVERLAAEEFRRIARENHLRDSYEDERPDFMNTPVIETSADNDRFGTVERREIDLEPVVEHRSSDCCNSERDD